MDTLDMALLIFAGVVLSMAGQLTTLVILAWSAKVVGEDAPDPADSLGVVAWPITLVGVLAAWLFAFAVALAAFLLDQGPPDDGPTGGSAC